MRVLSHICIARGERKCDFVMQTNFYNIETYFYARGIGTSVI